MPKDKDVASESSDLRSVHVMTRLVQDMVGVEDVAGVWEDLEDALRGVNGYGGDVAEIYAYRLMPAAGPSPAAIVDLAPSEEEVWGRVAADNLMSILRRFRELHPECEVYLDGSDIPLDVLDGQIRPFMHRIHVKVASPDESGDARETTECAYHRGRADALADALADVMNKIQGAATLNARAVGESPFRGYYNDACKKIVELEAWLKDARRALDEVVALYRAAQLAEKTRAAPTHDEVTEIRLCEASRLALHPGRLYRFTVAPGCQPCETAADLADPGDRASSHPPDSVPAARPSVATDRITESIWSALRALYRLSRRRGEADRFALDTDKDDLLTKRSLLLAATALEYAAAHLNDQQANNGQAAALIRWAEGFRSEFRGEG